jgi:hypothetical protein
MVDRHRALVAGRRVWRPEHSAAQRFRARQRRRTHWQRRRNLFMRNMGRQALPDPFVALCKRSLSARGFARLFTAQGRRWALKQLWRKSLGLAWSK